MKQTREHSMTHESLNTLMILEPDPQQSDKKRNPKRRKKNKTLEREWNFSTWRQSRSLVNDATKAETAIMSCHFIKQVVAISNLLQMAESVKLEKGGEE